MDNIKVLFRLYIEAVDLLYIYRRLSNHKKENISALWGQLSGYILLNTHNKIYETFLKLKDNIDSLVL